jgi:hypothetical protein
LDRLDGAGEDDKPQHIGGGVWATRKELAAMLREVDGLTRGLPSEYERETDK